jgi:N-acetylglucosaminyldiphosphoundecaprenol N-acetyl-beta-D-mannosaminyltransferase
MVGKIEIFGVKIDNLGLVDAVEIIANRAQEKQPCFVVTPNVDHVVRLEQDAEFRQIYSEACLVLADGMPLVWASKLLGTPLKERVSGSDLILPLAEAAAGRGLSIFLLGGEEGAAAGAADKLLDAIPGLCVAGTFCPEYGFEFSSVQLRHIEQILIKARPDILLVGLGSPKQEKWIYQYSRALHIPVAIGVGVSFSFLAGLINRAPRWMQRCGLEWLWRLCNEPKRLWRRYLIDDLPFFVMLGRALIKKRCGS